MTRALVGMKLERYLKAAGVGFAALTVACSVTAARAADITRTYDITASDFVAAFANSPPSPINSFDASFTITFDPTLNIVGSTVGLVVNYLSFTAATEYSYDPAETVLSIGTDTQNYSYISYTLNANSFGVYVIDPSIIGTSTNVRDVIVSYGGGPLYLNSAGTTIVSAVSAAPEPSSWLLMIAGLGLAGCVLRWREKMLPIASQA